MEAAEHCDTPELVLRIRRRLCNGTDKLLEQVAVRGGGGL